MLWLCKWDENRPIKVRRKSSKSTTQFVLLQTNETNIVQIKHDSTTITGRWNKTRDRKETVHRGKSLVVEEVILFQHHETKGENDTRTPLPSGITPTPTLTLALSLTLELWGWERMADQKCDDKWGCRAKDNHGFHVHWKGLGLGLGLELGLGLGLGLEVRLPHTKWKHKSIFFIIMVLAVRQETGTFGQGGIIQEECPWEDCSERRLER